MTRFKRLFIIALFLFPSLTWAGSDITLLFGGDIMAHSSNYRVKDLNDIWGDVKPIIQDSDLAFANIEAPVDSTKPVSSYPQFNMSVEYLQAAIDAGFSVFSLTNNHSNDQGFSGIQETLKTCKKLTQKYAESGRVLYFPGLKKSSEEGFNYNIIEKNGWKILFFPVTESLNSFNAHKYMNYVYPEAENKHRFAAFIKKLKAKVGCDLFILSFHTNEPEYIRTVADAQKQFYKELVDAGVDILWANHAHIIKDREIGERTLIMYSNGNTISGQRYSPNLTMESPNTMRDNTGDGLLYQVVLSKDASGTAIIKETKPYFITTYITPKREFILKPMNQDFINWLKETGQLKWAGYIEKRLKINLEQTKDIRLP